MDISCRFQYRNNILYPLNRRLEFRRDFGFTFVRKHNGVFLTRCVNGNAKRSLLDSSCYKLNSCWHGSHARRSLIGDDFCVFNSLGKVKTCCQGSDFLTFVNGNGHDVESVDSGEDSSSSSLDGSSTDGLPEKEGEGEGEEGVEEDVSVEVKELVRKALKELEEARLNSAMFEEKAQQISEAAIALKDEAENARNNVNAALDAIEDIMNQEPIAVEAVQKANVALTIARERLQVAAEALESAKLETDNLEGSEGNGVDKFKEKEEAVLLAEEDVRKCHEHVANCQSDLKQLLSKKVELQKEMDQLNGIAERAQMNALKAEEDVANIMVLAEQAVALELEAAQRINDAEIALQRAEKSLSTSDGGLVEEGDKIHQEITDNISSEQESRLDADLVRGQLSRGSTSDKAGQRHDELKHCEGSTDQENGRVGLGSSREAEIQAKRQEVQKDLTKESSPSNALKASLKKSSRFFSASFFSFNEDGKEVTASSVLFGLVESVKKQLPKVVLCLALLGSGIVLYANRAEKTRQLLQQSEIVCTSIQKVSLNTEPLLRRLRKFPEKIKKLKELVLQHEVNEEEASLFDVLWLLLASVIFVPIFQKIPGGSPVLGYLTAGILIGPYGLSFIHNVHATKAIAEFGVVFLLFNIGLELSVERLSSMKKYVFGLGSAQVLVTAVSVGMLAHYLCGLSGPAAIVIGNGLALSSTAVVLQVLQERGETTSRHGRATFSVLLFQDLAVVVLLILVPLISPNSAKGGVGCQAIAEALGLAGVKAMVAISAIIAGGRLFLRPIYKQIAENQNPEIFSANTLLVILGTSLLTARAGLSMALGAFLAGLLLAETEFSLQVESDIAPYRGLLLGLFFMTVGMSIDPKLLVSNFPVIMGTLALLIGGKTIMVALIGKLFGISIVSAIRAGLLLAPGGEFAFVAFGEAVNQGIMSSQLSSLLFLLVGISMALTPWLAAGGQLVASHFEQLDVRSLLPVESETDDLQDHIIICGFGRVGQIIAQLLSERLIPFVALDMRSDRVAAGRALDLPVYYGDAGSKEVLHKIGAERACAAAITLDSPGANYRTVWALGKYFPNVKTFVRARDVDNGLNLEKAGATAVVPETLEPSLQLAAAVLAQAKLPTSEIAATINEFRSRHLSELTELSEESGSSLGYGFSRVMSRPKTQSSDSSDDDQIDDQITEEALAT